MNKKLDWTDWLNAFNNIDDEKHYKDLEILRKFKDQLLEELEQKDQRIAELEKKLSELKQNAIGHKFNIGQWVFAIINENINKVKIERIIITLAKNDDENMEKYLIIDSYGYALIFDKDELYAAKQEAQTTINKLKEKQNE